MRMIKIKSIKHKNNKVNRDDKNKINENDKVTRNDKNKVHFLFLKTKKTKHY